MMFSGNSSVIQSDSRITQAGGSSDSVGLNSVDWTFEEYCKLQEGLEKYADEPNITKYLKIAAILRDKTVRDVALASRWLTRQRRKLEEHNSGKKVNSRMSGTISLDKTSMVVVDIESLLQPTDGSSGSPKMIRGLSREWLCRAEVLTNAEAEDIDESSNRTPAKELNSQLEPLMQSLLSKKSMTQNSANHGGSNLFYAAVGWNKKFNQFMGINPGKILCIVATLLSMASVVLIYFTLAINGTF